MTRQTVAVLGRMERRFSEGLWCRGAWYRPGGRMCLKGAAYDSTAWTLPGVRQRVGALLAVQLPGWLQPAARVAPWATLAFYNDWVGGRRGALRLVKAALAAADQDVRPDLQAQPVPERETAAG